MTAQEEIERLFKLSVSHAITGETARNKHLIQLRKFCSENYASNGYESAADFIRAKIPRSRGELSCFAWSSAELEISGWQLRIEFNPLSQSNTCANISIRCKHPIPNFSVTGYKKLFVPMTTFANTSPLEYLQKRIPPKVEKLEQMRLL